MANANAGTTTVQLIDPNDVNINTDMKNAVAQYQDMHIFAELTAKRKGRTVLTVNEGSSNDKEVTVNFIGNNQNDKNGDPNYLNFTSNYYDGSVGENSEMFESFGITNIKVTINSSYVPVINIKFVDIRGLSFFNQTDSKYRIFFDFPPPIFTLTIKGYYGRALKYDIHLVKYTTEFKAENGNFEIDAQFIAMTFAPLTDVLFRYAVNAPLLINNGATASPDPTIAPNHTFQFILKLKSLYTALNKDAQTNSDTTKYDNNMKLLLQSGDEIKMLDSFATQFTTNNVGVPFMFTVDESIETDMPSNVDVNIRPMLRLSSLSEYNSTIIDLGNDFKPLEVTNRLYIGYVSTTVADGQWGTNLAESMLINALDAYNKSKLNDKAVRVRISNNTDISQIPARLSAVPVGYVALDITEYYINIYKNQTSLINEQKVLSQDIAITVNNAIEQHLGMSPTIYNVFKLILDDVDMFFDAMRSTSLDAEVHHEKNKKIIADYIGGSKSDFVDKIFSYPLVIENGARIAPIQLNNQLSSDPMPEMELVYDFINTFQRQKQIIKAFEIREQKDENNVNLWIPISPIDSSSVNPDLVDSPYQGKSSWHEIVNVLLDRYYVLSQFAIPSDFIDDGALGIAYRNLYSKSEAMNISLTLNNDELIKAIEIQVNEKSGNIDSFYKDIDGRDVPSYSSGGRTVINGVYINKGDIEYSGCTVLTSKDGMGVQTLEKDGTKILEVFAQDVQLHWYNIIYNHKLIPLTSLAVTNENVIFVADRVEGSSNTNTRFAIIENGIQGMNKKQLDVWQVSKDDALAGGNQELINKHGSNSWLTDWAADDTPLKHMVDITSIWSNAFAHNIGLGTDIINMGLKPALNDPSNNDYEFVAMILLANFGKTMSPFNGVPSKIGPLLCQTPSVVEVPSYLAAYIGGLIYAKENNMLGRLEAFFEKYLPASPTSGLNVFNDGGLYVFADYYDVINNLSAIDKEFFVITFEDFIYTASFITMRDRLKYVYDLVIDQNLPTADARLVAFKDLFNQGGYFGYIFEVLLNKQYLVIYSENTFKLKPFFNDTQYRTLKALISTNNLENVSDTNKLKKKCADEFFISFLKELFRLIGDLKKTRENEKVEQIKALGDKDIVSQMYYSFKNINDKWMTSPNRNITGYPYNRAGRHLIDNFVFVDRTMNPIGNTIINPEILINLLDNPDVSIFTVLSQLLSLNHFLFFPLQNFMNHTRTSWDETFQIDVSNESEYMEAFVCMYVGGSSSYPSNINGQKSGFISDGMTDVRELELNIPELDPSDVQYGAYPNFPWKSVKAFNVKFGQQNQSMFTNIKIDSKEFPETNESIQILARMAGDEKTNAPVQKAQNLYNLYENRAYSATVTGLGNAMIQPTQYFQLDNIPLYNGAYLILSVEHDLTANKMTTSFTGTKILKYPVPRVLSSVAVMGFDGSSIGEYVTGAADAYNNNVNAGFTPSNSPNPNLVNRNYSGIAPAIVALLKTQLDAPIDSNVTTVTTRFRPSERPSHGGIDFAAPLGTPIWAAKAGKIIMKVPSQGYGTLLTIEHDDGTQTKYGHMVRFAFDPKTDNGIHVAAGKVVGFCGHEGRSRGRNGGNHLHFEYIVNGVAVDPAPYLKVAMPKFFK